MLDTCIKIGAQCGASTPGTKSDGAPFHGAVSPRHNTSLERFAQLVAK